MVLVKNPRIRIEITKLNAKRRRGADGLAQFSNESSFHGSIQGHLNDTEALLELLKASHVQITDDELVLESIGSWSSQLLKQQLRSGRISSHVDPAEVAAAIESLRQGIIRTPFRSSDLVVGALVSFHICVGCYVLFPG